MTGKWLGLEGSREEEQTKEPESSQRSGRVELLQETK